MTVKAKEAARAQADQAAAIAATQDQQQAAAAAAAESALTDAPPAPDSVAATDSRGERGHEMAAVADASSPPATDATAADVIAATVLPTPAPTASIGELAQTPAPASADTPSTSTDAPTPTTADTTNAAVPQDPATDAGGRTWNPWVVGGLAVLAVGGVAAAVANNDDDDDPPVAAPPPGPPAAPPPEVPPPGTPPAAPPAAPPPSADPLAPTGFDAGTYTKPGATAAVTGLYFADTANDNTFNGNERVVFYNAANQHYYELVTPAAPVTWDAANAAALTRGGHLFTGADAAEVAFVQDRYGFAVTGGSVPRGPAYGQNEPVYGGVPADELGGDLGAWVGLTASAAGAWTWITNAGAPGGAAFATADPLWQTHFAFSNPNGNPATDQLRGAMVGGNDLVNDSNAAPPNPAPNQVFYDSQGTVALPNYIVEYESLAQLNAGQATSVTLNSVTGGGSVDVAAAASSYAPTNLSSLIDDTSNTA